MSGLARPRPRAETSFVPPVRVVLAETVGEHLRQPELLLRDEALVLARAREHEIDDRGDSGGRRHLDRRPQPARDHLRIDLVDVVFLAQLAVLLAARPRHRR